MWMDSLYSPFHTRSHVVFPIRYEALLNQVAGLQREVAKQNADTKALRDENEVSFLPFFQRSVQWCT
jgi:hypothetical protein